MPHSHKPSCLCIDTAIVGMTLALRHEGRVFTHRDASPGNQAKLLVFEIEELLEQAGIWYDALDEVRVTVGPGSFTGIRIGLSVAQTIAESLGIPARPVTTLQAIALRAAGSELRPKQLAATLMAGKGEIYAQRFSLEHGTIGAVDDIAILDPASLPQTQNWPVFGNTQSALPQSVAHALPDAEDFLLLDELTLSPALPINQLSPLYIRQADAKLPGGHSAVAAG